MLYNIKVPHNTSPPLRGFDNSTNFVPDIEEDVPGVVPGSEQ